MKNLNHDTPTQTTLLKELFQHLDKDTITSMFTEVFGEKSNLSTQESTSSKGKEKMEDDTPMTDQDNLQDAQDPYEEDDIYALLKDDIHQFIPIWFKTFFFSWGVMPSILPRNVKNIWNKFLNANTQFDGLTAILQFAVNYNVPWIIRWEYGLQDMAKEKFDLKYTSTFLI